MRILRSAYHLLLFLIVSWTVYNTFIFICLILPPSENEFVEFNMFAFWNVYLLGALDFHEFAKDISEAFDGWLRPSVLREFWPFLLYAFLVKGTAIYIWCSVQNPFSALFLALAPCISGLYLTLLFRDGLILIYGMGGIIIFYTILYNLNDYRKKHLPGLTLPAWLEWRRPHMVPTLMEIADRFEQRNSK